MTANDPAQIAPGAASAPGPAFYKNFPKALNELHDKMETKSEFALCGNIRDLALLPAANGAFRLVPLLRALWETLARRNLSFCLVFDPSEGLRAYPAEEAALEAAKKFAGMDLSKPQPCSLERLADLARAAASSNSLKCAIVIDSASRIAKNPQALSEAEHKFFASTEKSSQNSICAFLNDGQRPSHNPLIWLLNRPQDLPGWKLLDSTKSHTLSLPCPDLQDRLRAAAALGRMVPGYAQADPAAQSAYAQEFAFCTQGCSFQDMADIAMVANSRQFPMARIADAARLATLGTEENPWGRSHLKERIAGGLALLEKRVKGQRAACVKALDIIKRSATGMTGAHGPRKGNRPRGTLFFAGPTGVGKTELAKTLTELIFGSEGAYLRFDMSEFSEEHSGARLLGAPPGYIGYDAGGALTNAIKAKPFCVCLFDEIEKAHPRILDKFLQILEDGRLTDGRGETAHFSECLIVFTSNIGIHTELPDGTKIPNVAVGDPPETVQAKVSAAIKDHFKFKIGRPEILNRIGENIVVFNFIDQASGVAIFDGMVENVAKAVLAEQRVALEFEPEARNALLSAATADLSNGGRGIGNQIENLLVNPLARILFDGPSEPGATRLAIRALRVENGVATLEHAWK